jgi:superfamily II DNA or RNA helicase
MNSPTNKIKQSKSKSNSISKYSNLDQILSNARLTKQGYIISKSDLTNEQIETIENDLTVEPKTDTRFKKFSEDDGIFNIYLETISGDKLVMPRNYGLAKFGMPTNPSNIKFDIKDIDRAQINFRGELRDYQKDVMNVILNEYCTDINLPSQTLKSFGGSIITIPPGKGKTVLAIKLICDLGLRALVIVHKTFLLNQWKERFSQYTDEEIGLIRQDKIDISNKKIVVAMLQSVSMKEYDRELFQAFPLVIYDECHHLGAKMFSKSLIKVQAPFYLGLSATPERKDKMDKVFKYFLGDIKYRGKFDANTNVKVKMYSYTIEHLYFKSIYNGFMKMYMEQPMTTNICKIDERNNLIIKLIKEILDNEPSRKILVLTGRVNASKSAKGFNHVKALSDKLNTYENFVDDWGYYIGGMKEVQLEISSEKRIILGTYDMAQEGLDIPSLDTIIFASPLKGNLTQTCGRILRGGNGLQPLIIDIMDMVVPFSTKSQARYGYYLENKYNCEYYLISDGYDINQITQSDKAFLSPSYSKKKAEKVDEDLFED